MHSSYDKFQQLLLKHSRNKTIFTHLACSRFWARRWYRNNNSSTMYGN